MSTRPLTSPGYRGAPAQRVIELLQRGQPGIKQVVALSKGCCRFGVGKLSLHGRQNRPTMVEK